MATDDTRWAAVDAYLDDTLIGADPVLSRVLDASARANLPAIAVSPTQGRFLHILARMVGARRILELGTLGGYSGIWLARALPADGRLVTVEADARHAAVARESFALAGLADRVDLRVGRALDVLDALGAAGVEPFDVVFIDADKVGYAEYLERAVPLCRPGAVIVADNVVRNGAVADGASRDASVQGVRRFLAAAAGDARLVTTAVQTVGSKGYDGFAILLVEA